MTPFEIFVAQPIDGSGSATVSQKNNFGHSRVRIAGSGDAGSGSNALIIMRNEFFTAHVQGMGSGSFGKRVVPAHER